MSEWRLRDHTQPCEHDLARKHATGWWSCGWDGCPGGREIVLRELYFPVDAWQEVDDDE